MARAFITFLSGITLCLFSLLILPSAFAAAAASTPVVGLPLIQPNWTELTPQQQQTLAPLAKDWDELSVFRKKKWIGIAARYPAMTPEQQQRVHTQMKPWTDLTPEERKAARERYLKHHKSAPDQREAKRQKWQEYKALPESEKRKFREKAANKTLPKRAGGQSATRPLTHPAAPATTPLAPVAPALSATPAGK